MSTPLAAAVTAPQTGLLDLEKELVCSICTETLYQPLTLLDCLHTFCGSCLKEWFTFEYNKARSSSSSSSRSNPYTCPTCRATVKDARHNATVTTLLEMFLAANPARGKSEEDKADIARSYTPGENILPKPEHGGGRRSRRREEEERAEEAERRQLEEARERSIRETSGTAAQVGTHLAAPVSEGGSSRSRSRESREQRRRDDERREERRERRRRAEAAEAQFRERDAAASSSTITAPVASLTTDNLTAARLSPPTTSPRHPSAVEARQRERQIVPQTSLRSLMGSSESGAGTGDSLEAEQILQQIFEDGLLEGIDLHDLNPAQEDALSERIAQAYRQRQENRGAETLHQPRDGARREHGRTSSRTRVRGRQQEAERRHHQRSHSAHNSSNLGSRQATSSDDRRPPASRIRFQDGESAFTAHRRRASDNERKRDFPTPRSRGTNSEDVVRNATRSATDLSHRPRTSEEPRGSRPRRPSDTRRTNTEPEVDSASDRWRRVARSGNANSSGAGLHHLGGNVQLPAGGGAPTAAVATPRARSAVVTTASPTSSPRTIIQSTTVVSPSQHTATPSQQDPPRPSAQHLSEPSIPCARCSRPNIQYDLHKHCSQCSSNICLRCYRTVPGIKLGCTTDSVAESAPSIPAPTSPSRSQPHTFTSRKFLRPDASEQVLPINPPPPLPNGSSNNDPSSRLQEGKFCDLCHSFANVCYWSCDTCNKGDWGFCNSCINRHHCCTHPLLPLAHKSYAPRTPTLHQGPNPDSGIITLTPSNLHADVLPTVSSTTRSRPSTSSSSTMTDYVPLTFTTHCDICTYPIPPSHTRFHCPSHPSSPESTSSSDDISNALGDYDICTSCYLSLLKLRKLRKEDGPNGWRRCPQGHRMIVIGFEDAAEGQKRVVVNDLVGGHLLREAETAKQGEGRGNGSGQWSWIEDDEGGAGGGGTVKKKRESRVRIPHANHPISSSSSSNQASHLSPHLPDNPPGLRALAIYPWFPEDGEPGRGELMFPRWAEIREVEDVNGEWWAGVYAGNTGVFPGGCVRVI